MTYRDGQEKSLIDSERVMPKIKAVDFFCGAGGLTRGMLDAGIEVLFGIDCDPECQKTYVSNNGPAKFLECDIRNLKPRTLQNLLKGVPQRELMFAACAPCQPFSKQRTDKSRPEDRTLLGYFGALVEEYRPNYVFVENVPGISKVSGRSTYRRFFEVLEDIGYSYDARDIDAKDYGVPQTRRRHIILACRSFEVRIPNPSRGNRKVPYKTVREAISHFPPIAAGETHLAVPNHRSSALADINLKRIRLTPPDGGDRRSWPKSLLLKCHSKDDYNGHTDVYGRMWWDRPAPALTCKCHSLSNGRYGHPEQDRAISLREAAALQTFADDYVFYGSIKESIGNQIGNAVPVDLAKAMAQAFISPDQR